MKKLIKRLELLSEVASFKYIDKIKDVMSKFDSAREFGKFKLRGFGAKSSSDIVSIIDRNSRTHLDLNEVRKNVDKGGKWYFLHKIDISKVKIEGDIGFTGKEDLSKPIVVGKNNIVLDGRHRVVYARKKGMKELPAYVTAEFLYNEIMK